MCPPMQQNRDINALFNCGVPSNSIVEPWDSKAMGTGLLNDRLNSKYGKLLASEDTQSCSIMLASVSDITSGSAMVFWWYAELLMIYALTGKVHKCCEL